MSCSWLKSMATRNELRCETGRVAHGVIPLAAVVSGAVFQRDPVISGRRGPPALAARQALADAIVDCAGVLLDRVGQVVQAELLVHGGLAFAVAICGYHNAWEELQHVQLRVAGEQEEQPLAEGQPKQAGRR